jgi:hypothetical protein
MFRPRSLLRRLTDRPFDRSMAGKPPFTVTVTRQETGARASAEFSADTLQGAFEAAIGECQRIGWLQAELLSPEPSEQPKPRNPS